MAKSDSERAKMCIIKVITKKKRQKATRVPRMAGENKNGI